MLRINSDGSHLYNSQKEDREWIDEALQILERIAQKSSSCQILLIRRQDSEGEHDVTVRNATEAEVIAKLALAINGPATLEDNDA